MRQFGSTCYLNKLEDHLELDLYINHLIYKQDIKKRKAYIFIQSNELQSFCPAQIPKK